MCTFSVIFLEQIKSKEFLYTTYLYETMKFVLCSARKCGHRLGKIIEIQRLPELSLETPLLLLHSKGGSIPHITHEVLQMICEEPVGIQAPVTSTLHSEEAVRDFGKGLAEFIGLKENLIYCTLQDSAIGVTSGYNDSNTVSVFTRKGRHQLDAKRYMNIMEAFCPDMYQILHDGDINANSGKKRILKSVTRTMQFTELCLERHNKSEVLQGKGIVGVIEGGLNVNIRENCAMELRKHPFAGFVIDGLGKQGHEVEHIQLNEIKEVIEKTLKCLPTEKFRIIHGCWSPESVLDLIEMGIDIFDGSYPYIVTERGSALIFQNKFERDNVDSHKRKMQSYEENHLNCCSANNKYEINLGDKMYMEDLNPISTHCSCLTCKEHSRSYVYHLLNAKELLGTVLLMIHNLHHYLEFFKTIRRCIREDHWEEFRECFREENK